MNLPTYVTPRGLRRITFAAGLSLALPLLSGCVAEDSGAVAYGPPPPPRYEVEGVAPGPGYFWIHGHWGWRYGRYVWIPGHWAGAPHRGEEWMEGHWEHRGGSYLYIDGYWH